MFVDSSIKMPGNIPKTFMGLKPDATSTSLNTSGGGAHVSPSYKAEASMK